MGNRMFVYAFSRILAQKRGCECFCAPLPNFPKTSQDVGLPSQIGFIANPITTRKYGNHWVDMNDLLTTERDVVVNSFLQKAEYYIDYKDFLSEFFWWEKEGMAEPDEDELVIHLRETDYVDIGITISHDFYKNAIKTLGYTKVSIVTDDCTTKYIQELMSEGIKVLSTQRVNKFDVANTEAEMLDYAYMLKSKHLLISHSTFSWWPAFLGNQEKIFYPVVSKSMWKEPPEKDDIDLFIPNKNFIKI